MNTELMSETHAIARPLNCLTRLKSIIRGLSALAEFCLILLVGFGPLMVFVLPNLLRPKPVVVNNAGVLWFPLVELELLIPVLWIGKLRGWSLSTFGSKISWKATGAGILLFVVAESVNVGVAYGVGIIHPEQACVAAGRLAVLPIQFISLVNPVYEEVLENAYFVHQLNRFGMWPAVLVSAAFRGLFHLQFGINAVLGIFAFGVVFAFVYWRWRQLWPLIVAHSLADLLSLFYASFHAVNRAPLDAGIAFCYISGVADPARVSAERSVSALGPLGPSTIRPSVVSCSHE
jgi:membrane protease YdiL (CAAX protease family)